MFGLSSITHLNRGVYDHAPLCINLRSSVKSKSKLFRYQPFWNYYREPHQIISSTWNHSDFDGDKDLDFNRRLHDIRMDLAFWNRNKIGKLEDNLFKVDSQIYNLQSLKAKRPISQAEQLSLSSLINKSKAISH